MYALESPKQKMPDISAKTCFFPDILYVSQENHKTLDFYALILTTHVY